MSKKVLTEEEQAAYVTRFNTFSKHGGPDVDGENTNYNADKDATQKAEIIEAVLNAPMEEGEKKELLGKLAKEDFGGANKDLFKQSLEGVGSEENRVKFAAELKGIGAAPAKASELETEKKPTVDKPKDKEKLAKQEELAEDSFAFVDNAPNKRELGQNQAVNADLEEDLDPITKAIREQIIAEQKKLLKEALDKGNKIKDFDGYLKDPNKKQVIHDTIDKDLDLQKKLEALEVNGYAAIHNQFKDRFKTLAWEGAPSQDVRTQTVTNKGGQKVCDLTETTVKTSVTIPMADGSTKEIKSYRKIDFPTAVAKGTGPMHVSLAVRDEEGRPIAKDKAVYFTAHYDKEGKLTEVSSPVPLKFAGKGDDAIGYIEREGKIYTVPVTQKQYTDMMIEVGKNKGHGVDMSKGVEGVASDSISLDHAQGAVDGKDKKKEVDRSGDSAVVGDNGNVVVAEKEQVQKPNPAAMANSIRGKLMNPPDQHVLPKKLSKEDVTIATGSYVTKFNTVPDDVDQTTHQLATIKSLSQDKRLLPVDRDLILDGLQKNAEGTSQKVKVALIDARAPATKPIQPQSIVQR